MRVFCQYAVRADRVVERARLKHRCRVESYVLRAELVLIQITLKDA